MTEELNFVQRARREKLDALVQREMDGDIDPFIEAFLKQLTAAVA